MASTILSMVGWQLIPDLVTGVLLKIWYGISIRAGDPKPRPGSPKYIQHYRRAKILVVSIYLIFTIFEADREILKASDYYQDLGVSHQIDERGIKSRFRRLAALHHPDKLSSSNPSSEGYFVHLKLAQDTLMNPVKRFAYDRFGPEILEWQHCASYRDHIMKGLSRPLGNYLGSAFMIFVMGLFGFLGSGAYWIWFTVLSLFVFEAHVITRPYFPAIATKLINPIISTLFSHPPYLPFQLLTLFRRMALTLHIAFYQIGPLLQSPELRMKQANPEVTLQGSLDRLDHTATSAEMDARRLVALEMAPYAGKGQVLKEVQTKAEQFLVRNAIRADPEVRDAYGRALQRRRADAPAGARGNR